MPQRRYRIYGLTLASDLPFVAPLEPSGDPTDITFDLVEGPPQERSGSQRLYTSASERDDGEPAVVLDRGPEVHLLRFAGAATYAVREDRITCYLLDERYRLGVEVWLLGTVLSLWLELHGIRALHAAAIIVDGRAVGFMGTNGSGKSTLAADLVRVGQPLLTDDILPLKRIDGEWRAHAGFPQMRMWPEQAVRLLGGYEDLDRVLPWGDKRRVPVGESGFGTFWPQPAPLAALYVPIRVEESEIDVVVESVPSVEALATLFGQSFVAPLANAAVSQAERLEQLGYLVSRVPIRRITYRSGYDRLPAVRTALLEDIRGL